MKISGWMLSAGAACGLLLAACSPASPTTQRASRKVPVPEVSTQQLDPFLATTLSGARLRVLTNDTSALAWGRLGQALDAADFDAESQACYREAARLDPAGARWFHLLGLRQLREQPDLALENLRRAVQLTGETNDAPVLRLALALSERGRFVEATNRLRSLLAGVPDHPAARLELARASLALGRLGGLPDWLAPCLTNPYTTRAAHLILGQVLLRNGDTEASSRHAQLAAAMPKPFDWPDPFLREVQELRQDTGKLAEQANSLLRQSRWAEAELVLTQLLSHVPESPEGVLLLGRVRLQQRRCAEAEALFQRFLQLRHEAPYGWMQLGMAFYCQSRWAEAARAFEEAVARKADFAQAHFNLGMARSRLRNSPAAMASFREALRCTPGDVSVHMALAEELFRIGETAAAREQVTQALGIDPNHPKANALRRRLDSPAVK